MLEFAFVASMLLLLVTTVFIVLSALVLIVDAVFERVTGIGIAEIVETAFDEIVAPVFEWLRKAIHVKREEVKAK